MTDVCRSINGGDQAVYDRVDLTRFDHPNDVNTGWTCYHFDFDPTSPGQKVDLNRYCLEADAPWSSGAVLVSPGQANNWHCQRPDGPSPWTIDMETACRYLNSISWTDRTLNVFDPDSIYCYR